MSVYRALSVSSCIFFLAVVGCVAVVTGPGTDREVTPRDDNWAYPDPIAGWSDDIKAAQLEAGKVLPEFIAAEIAAGSRHIDVPRGDYRFGAVHGDGRPYHVKLQDVHDVTIDFHGSTFWMTNQQTAVSLIGCTGVTMKNLFVDWDPLPFTQGTVVAVDTKKKTIDVKLHPGFDRVTYVFRKGLAPRSKIRGAVYTPETGLLKPGNASFQVNPFWDKPVSPGVYRVHPRTWYNYPLDKMSVAPGDHMVLWKRGGSGFRIHQCSRITLEDVTMYCSSGFAVAEGRGQGGNTYRRVSIVPRPSTRRLIGGTADGIHSMAQERGPRLIECKIHGLGDDFFNVHGFYRNVWGREAPNVLLAQAYAERDRMPQQQEVKLYRFSDKAFLGSRRTVSVKRGKWTGTKENFIGKVFARPDQGKEPPYGKTITVTRIEMDKPIEFDEPVILTLEGITGNDYLLKDCTFRNTQGRVVAGASRGLIENCTVDWTSGTGVMVYSNMGYWGESTIASDVTIRGCTISNNNLSALRYKNGRPALYVATPNHWKTTGLVTGLRIENNTIVNPGLSGIGIFGARDVLLKNNRIVAPNTRSHLNYKNEGHTDRDYGIVIENVKGLTMQGNAVEDPGEHNKGKLRKQDEE